MTMEDAITQARQDLSSAATDDDIATLAASYYMTEMSPTERERVLRRALEEEAFEVVLEHATELTDEQIQALELTEEQAARMAAHRVARRPGETPARGVE